METPEPHVWLDDLPDDVNLHIASVLQLETFTVGMNRECLSLARVSHKQTRVVLTAMENCVDEFDFRSMEPEAAESWCTTVSPYCRHLNLRNKHEAYDTVSSRIRGILLKSPNLESIDLLPEPGVLESIANIPSLRSLHFSSADCYEQSPLTLTEHIPVLFDTLSKLNLTSLDLECRFLQPLDEYDICGFETLLKHDPDPAALGRCCPNVHALTIRCSHMYEWAPLPQLLDGFANLRDFRPDFAPEELTESLEISSALVEKMRNFDSVHLSFIDFLFSRGPEIGAPVKTLQGYNWKYHKMYEAPDMEELSKCPNLVTLTFCVKPGVEKAFPNVAKHFKSLRTLSIEWDVPRIDQRCNMIARAYQNPPPQFLRAVEELPMLSDLSLVYVTLAIDDVRRLLQKMGNRLKSLGVSNRGQAEPPAERLTLLMDQLARSNPQLRRLYFQDDDDVLKDRRRWKKHPQKRWGSAPFRVIEPRMRRAFYMLRRNACFLDWKHTVRSAQFSCKLNLIPAGQLQPFY